MSSAVIETLRSCYVRHRQELYAYAVSITRDRAAAEDAIHAAFQQLLRRSVLPEDVRPYVFRSVRNAALDAFRRARTEADHVLASGPATGAVDAVPGERLSADEVAAGLRELTDDEREAVVLRIYSDLTFQEIADTRGVPLPTAASWYRRGLEKLKSRLTKECR
jgi:RNA polymerase sigma-70 factor (ECF subfamily)